MAYGRNLAQGYCSEESVSVEGTLTNELLNQTTTQVQIYKLQKNTSANI